MRARGQRPNLLVTGVRKAGTTSLFHYLGQHPEICCGMEKEPSFFTPLKYGRPTGDLDSYLRSYARCGPSRYRLDASPGYFTGGSTIATAADHTLPGAHALVILRNPVETFWSNYRFQRSRLTIDKEMDVRSYLDECERLHEREEDGTWENRAFNSIRAGLYDRVLPAWFDQFGDRFRVELFDDLAADPVERVSAICAWLGLETDVVARFDFSIENRTVQYRNGMLQRVALAGNRRFKPMFRRYRGLKLALRRGYYRVNQGDEVGSMPADVRERLEDRFLASNRATAELLHSRGFRSLPVWLDHMEHAANVGHD